MLDYLPQTSEWDEPALDDDIEPASTTRRSHIARGEAKQHRETVLLGAIEGAQTQEALILFARVALSHALADRLNEIMELEDIEAGDNEDIREPRLLAASIKSFLKFCLRAVDFLDERFLPGRTYAGELGLQFLDPRLGDLSIRFLADGRALVAFIAQSHQGSCQCAADDLLTDRDPFVVNRWLEPVSG